MLGFGESRGVYLDAAGAPPWRNRVHILDPVPPSDPLSWVASANVGAVLVEPSTLNYYLSTPNKLFESLAAGIPVVASDFPVMRRIVAGDPAGPLAVLCEPTHAPAVAATLRSMLELDDAATAALRGRCLAAARSRWNWQAEFANLTRYTATCFADEASPWWESPEVELEVPLI